MHSLLAPREQQYTEAALKGLSDKEIARNMNCSPGNVHSIARRARFKLNAKNRMELVINALKEGVIELCLIVCILCQTTGLSATFNFEEPSPTDIERNMPRPRNRTNRTRSSNYLRLRLRTRTHTDLAAEIGSEIYQTYDLLAQQKQQLAQHQEHHA